MTDTGGKKSITIISNNLAGGGSLACLSLGRALRPHFDVQIIGCRFGNDLWPGLHGIELDLTEFPGAAMPEFLKTCRRMRASIRGDAVIAHQYRLASFGVGLAHRMLSGTPCAVYIDDDDIALTMPGRSNRLSSRLRTVNGDIPTRLMYRLRGRADAVICGSDYFASRLGGVTVPLGRDSSRYEPDRSDRRQIRESLGLTDRQTVIGFMGNPRPHVGIEDLVRALEIIDDESCVLVVTPPGEIDEYAARLFAGTTANVKVFGSQPSDKVPGFLAASDLVVVPQRNELMSLGQLPARLVEAMAMAKPIIVTNIVENLRLLDGNGLIVDERSPTQLADAIQWIRHHPGEAERMGRNVRQIFLNKLSLEAMADKLVPILDRLLIEKKARRH